MRRYKGYLYRRKRANTRGKRPEKHSLRRGTRQETTRIARVFGYQAERDCR